MTLTSLLPAGLFLKQEKSLLLLGSVVLAVSGIILQNQGILPLDPVSFFFFSFILFLLGVYRPGWLFLLFIAMLPLETLNVAPSLLGGMALRPYQWLGGIALGSVCIRLVFGRLPFRFFEPRWFDLFLPLVAVGGFFSLMTAPAMGSALKQAIIVVSFVGLYFLGRIFFRTRFDILQAMPFFLASSVVVLLYAVWQNGQALLGRESFQVMVGRPNATFSEADWLGLFVIVVLGALYAFGTALGNQWKKRTERIRASVWLGILWIFLGLSFLVLILTVARSAWLGAAALSGLYGVGLLFFSGVSGVRSGVKRVLASALFAGSSLVVALAVVVFFHLSPFQLFHRIQSTGTGLQLVTVSCLSDVVLPERVTQVEELSALGCSHIPLEQRVAEEEAGHFVKEVFRDDPNIALRKHIYQEVFTLLREHAVLGIGWGSVALTLGTDGRGAGLNASNIFLEAWLGSGLLGFVALVSFSLLLLLASLRWYRDTAAAQEERLFALTLFALLSGVLVFNLFNSGMLLGFFFILLSITALALERLPWLRQTNTSL